MLTFQTLPARHVSEFAAAVREGLLKPGQRELPSKYLYDEVGSALFEAICLLPEYGLTRADARLLQTHAQEIVDRLPSPIHVAELGSGSGKKTRWILEALSRRQRTYYFPIEISPAALAACEKELGQIDMVSMVGYEQPYLEGLQAVAQGREEGETIWTESSHKYRAGEVVRMAERTGFRCEGQWIDGEWAFAQNLFVVE